LYATPSSQHLHHTPQTSSFFSSLIQPPPTPTLFPYTTLFRSGAEPDASRSENHHHARRQRHENHFHWRPVSDRQPICGLLLERLDRKSTRLNSSHVSISYAVFCLKKKI